MKNLQKHKLVKCYPSLLQKKIRNMCMQAFSTYLCAEICAQKVKSMYRGCSV